MDNSEMSQRLTAEAMWRDVWQEDTHLKLCGRQLRGIWVCSTFLFILFTLRMCSYEENSRNLADGDTLVCEAIPVVNIVSMSKQKCVPATHQTGTAIQCNRWCNRCVIIREEWSMKKPFADPEGIIRYVQMKPHFKMKEYSVTVCWWLHVHEYENGHQVVSHIKRPIFDRVVNVLI